MKALILAAGYGKRLRPITDEIPKSMVAINGVPLLVNALNILTECGINDIGIVVGHKADYIKGEIGDKYNGASISYYENDRYLETNNVVSLFKAESFIDDDTLLLECDLWYKKELIDKLLDSDGDISILASPFNKDTMDGTVIRIDDGKVTELILGKWQDEAFDYSHTLKTVNMYRFSKDFIKDKYMPLIRWYVENVSENDYYEKVLCSLIYLNEFDITAVEVPESMWCEIDDADDLKRAETYFG